MDDDILIRRARPEDAEDICRLAKELCNFVKITFKEDVLRENLSNVLRGDSVANYLVAESNKKIVGYCMYYFVSCSWSAKGIFVEELVVDSQTRGKGVGSALLEKCFMITESNGANRIEFVCCDWNKKAINFYSEYGAENNTETTSANVFCMEADIFKSKTTQKRFKMDNHIQIRESRPDDSEDIGRLAKELCDFVKIRYREDDLRKNLSNVLPGDLIANYLVAESNKKIVGYCMYFFISCSWSGKGIFLEELVVDSESRGKGIGSALLEECFKNAESKGANRIELICDDWNKKAISFYSEYGAENLTKTISANSFWIEGNIFKIKLNEKRNKITNSSSCNKI